MEFIARFKNALFLILVLMAQALALAVQVKAPLDSQRPDGPSVRLLRLWANALALPLERGVHGAGSGVRAAWSNYLDLRHVRSQNQNLQQQIARMRIQQAAIAEDALEGRRLESLLAFRERYVATTVPAQVIGSSGSEITRVLTIDKGWRDGLKPDMAVITQDGIVGKLRDVFPTTSQVLEIDDQSAGVGVLLESTRIRAILRGTVTGHVQIGNLTADSRIQPGETVLTSGGDQVFPRGLRVGTVESIAPDPEHQPYTAIAVHPAVDLDRVEEVLVITGTQADLPAQTQEDLAAAQARHAEDAGAGQLPGGAEAVQATGPAAPLDASSPASLPAEKPAEKPAGPTVPHPLPALHPDRFSSGATAPAADLTPGARSSGSPSPVAARRPDPEPAMQPAPNPDAEPATPPPAAPPPANPPAATPPR